MLLFAKIFSSEFIRAVSWTLVHSLWQGLVVALLAGIMILFTRKAPSSTRYNFLALFLCIFLVATGITFYRELNNPETTGISQPNASYDASAGTTALNTQNLKVVGDENYIDSNVIAQAAAFVDAHTSMIVFAWFLFFLVNFIRLSSGLVYIHRLRFTHHYPVPPLWKARLNHLCQMTCVRVPILFLQSELVKVPVVIGIFKPVILVPIGLLTNLPAVQVEAILLHELAHIRRKDFLVNLVQSFAATVFFFNPAILWISSLLREEREACCDDMVIGFTPDKKTYLEALVSFQEYSLGNAGQAMAFGGKRNFLLNRVSRMLTQENKKLNVMEKTVLLAGVVALTAFSFIQQPTEKKLPVIPLKQMVAVTQTPAQHTYINPESIKPVPVKKHLVARVSRDTVPKKITQRKDSPSGFPSISSSINDDGKTKTSQVEATDKAGKKYRITRINDEITAFSVDGVTIPADEIKNYHPVIAQIESQRNANAEATQKRSVEDRERQNLEREVRMKEKINRLNEKQVKMHVDQQKQIEGKHAQRQLEQKKRIDENKVKMKEDQKKRIEENQVTLKKKMLDQEIRQNKFNQSRKLFENRKAINSNRFSNDEVSSIINELMNSKVIDNNETLSFTLNNQVLTVNGKQQPAELQQRLKEKYIQKPGDYFNYEKKGNSTHISINKD